MARRFRQTESTSLQNSSPHVVTTSVVRERLKSLLRGFTSHVVTTSVVPERLKSLLRGRTGFGAYAIVNPSGNLRNRIWIPKSPETIRTASHPKPPFNSPHSPVCKICALGCPSKKRFHSARETSVIIRPLISSLRGGCSSRRLSCEVPMRFRGAKSKGSNLLARGDCFAQNTRNDGS